MAVNKVVYGDNTLIDLTEDTVTAETLAEGVTAHDAAGNQITGTMASGGGGDAPDAFFACLQNFLFDPNGEVFNFIEVFPFKTGMTWREFLDSKLNPSVSFNIYGGLDVFRTRINDRSDEYFSSPPEIIVLTSEAVNIGNTAVNIKDANGVNVDWDDVIQPFVLGDDSTIYNCTS